MWKALVDNASRLIEDARLLDEHGSSARAVSLTVIAQEELGKALWIYDVFQQQWSDGTDDELEVEAVRRHGRDHLRKFQEATEFGADLAAFWGDCNAVSRPAVGESIEEVLARQRADAEAAATRANLAKQAGFYVDVAASAGPADGDEPGPLDVTTELEHAARVVEMLLINDHVRMKHNASTPYDNTHEQQFRLLPISHAEEYAAWLGADDQPSTSDGDAEPSG